MTEKKPEFIPRKLRTEYFGKYFPYDDELARIVEIKQISELKKTEQNYDFLKKPLLQNQYIYLIEYLLAFACKWFKKTEFKVLDWGCGKCQVSYLLQKRNIEVISCDVDKVGNADSAFGQYTPIVDFAKIKVIPLKHEYRLPFAERNKV